MNHNILDSDLSQGDGFRNVTFAGFWIRVGAALVDTLAFIPVIVLSFYNMMSWKIYLLDVLLTFSWIIYKPYFEYKYQATLGKMAVGIKVVSEDLKGITIEQSVIRFTFYLLGYLITLFTNWMIFNNPEFQEITSLIEVSEFQAQESEELLSMITSSLLFISIIFVAFDAQRQALHDKMAKTFVIYR